MAQICCICKKELGMEEDVTFHLIPKREDVKLKWLDAIGREVSKNRRVRSKHFHEHCIFYTCMKNGSIKRCLRPGAIPTLHLTKEMLRHESTITINNNLDSENAINKNLNFENVVDKNLYSENLIAHEDSVKARQVRVDSKDYEQDSFNLEHTTCETQLETENIQIVVNTAIKRKSESGEVNQKRRRLTNRYVGDFCRDDFTSVHNWKLFRKYYEETLQKLKVFQARDRRKSS
ncbi:uncharacterized protein [Temnothorax longispinosus]|uniref:uncharacterized protein isoform X2 n=1 Tax=Temnothorax longispinosus TaxID=300112 RepID=UPI003A9A2A22